MCGNVQNQCIVSRVQFHSTIYVIKLCTHLMCSIRVIERCSVCIPYNAAGEKCTYITTIPLATQVTCGTCPSVPGQNYASQRMIHNMVLYSLEDNILKGSPCSVFHCSHCTNSSSSSTATSSLRG